MKKLLIFIPIALILAGLSGCVGGNDMAEPIIFVHCYDYETSDYAIWSFTAEGIFVNKWTTPEWNQENNLCVDSLHNVYMISNAWNVIKKWDKNGALLKSKTTDWTTGIAIGPDGYLYTRQSGLVEFGESYVIVKRDPDTLEAVSHIVMTHVGREFTFDPDGYFYVRHDPNIEKWNYDTETMIVSHAISPANNWVSFAQANGIIGFCADGADVYTIPVSLDEDQTAWGLADPQHIAAIDNSHFITSEYDSADKYYKLRKYTSAGSLVWETNIEHRDNITVYGIGAYPFAREVAQPIIALIG